MTNSSQQNSGWTVESTRSGRVLKSFDNSDRLANFHVGRQPVILKGTTWQHTIPAGCSISWPVKPYNSYHKHGDADLDKARVVITTLFTRERTESTLAAIRLPCSTKGAPMPGPDSVETLQRMLSEPSAELVEIFSGLRGRLLLLGVGGKMGPATAEMARRAAVVAGTDLRVIGVSRFTDETKRQELEAAGVETIAGDLLDVQLVASLPDADYVLSLVGAKFGTSEDPSYTWATNCYTTGLIATRYRGKPIVALSTGNVYGPVSVDSASGSRETATLDPVGEYAQSALGRERVYNYYAQRHSTPVCLVRLNYATEMRYGVLVDIANRVAQGQPVSLQTSHFNIIWQRDASDWILRCLTLCTSPARPLNITGRRILRTDDTAREFARLFDTSVSLSGASSAKALLSDPSEAYRLFGEPTVSAEDLIGWVAEWIRRERPTWTKPTGFESSDGSF